MSREIIFVCYVDVDIGWGHLSRMIALHDAVMTLVSVRVKILIHGSEPLFAKHLANRNGGFFEAFDDLISVLQRGKCIDRRVVLDHPTAEPSDIERLVEVSGPLILFYSQRRRFIADHWVRQMIIPRSDSIKIPVSLKSRSLVGMAFTPLRKQFYQRVPEKSFNGVRRIFVCFGGSRQAELIGRILEAIQLIQFDGVVTVVSGASLNGLIEQYQNDSFNLEIVVGAGANEIVELIDASDIGLISAGTVAQECFSRGLVCGILEAADDQIGLKNTFIDKGLCVRIDADDAASISDLIRIDKASWEQIRIRLSQVNYRKAANQLLQVFVT